MPSPITPLEEAQKLLEYYTRKENRAGRHAEILRDLIELHESRVMLDTADECQFWELDPIAGFLVDTHTAPECLRPFPGHLKELLAKIIDPTERTATAAWFQSLWAATHRTAAIRVIRITGTPTQWLAVLDVLHNRLLGTVRMLENNTILKCSTGFRLL